MKLRYLYLILIVAFANASHAQSGYRSSLKDYYLANSIDGGLFFQRLSMGGGLHFIPGTANLHFMGMADSTYQDTTLKRSMFAKQSFAFYIGSYIPITLISDNSMLVLEIEFMGSISKLAYDSIEFSKTTKVLAPQDAFKIGLPLSLEYRSGSDVMLNKQIKTMFTLGAGINFCLVNSSDFNKVNPYRIEPFIKAEIGFVAGMAFKIRGVYSLGNSMYNYSTKYNVATNTTGDNTLVSEFKGANGYNLSLIIMPFSVNWNR